MAVKIRLARRGRKKLAMFDVVVAKATSPRDGRFIEKIGTYNPNTNPATIVLDETKAFNWVMNGAQPTDTVRAMLSYRGILLKKHLQVGVNKGAITQEDADAKFEEWKNQQESKISGKIESLAQKKEAERKARFEAEAKVKEARAEAQRKKNEVKEDEAPEGEPLSEHAELTPVAEAVVAEDEGKVEATASEEAPEEEPLSEHAEQTPVAQDTTPTPATEAAPEAAEEAPKEEAAAEAPKAEAPAAEEAPQAEAAEETPKAEAAEKEEAADEAAEEKKGE